MASFLASLEERLESNLKRIAKLENIRPEGMTEDELEEFRILCSEYDFLAETISEIINKRNNEIEFEDESEEESEDEPSPPSRYHTTVEESEDESEDESEEES